MSHCRRPPRRGRGPAPRRARGTASAGRCSRGRGPAARRCRGGGAAGRRARRRRRRRRRAAGPERRATRKVVTYERVRAADLPYPLPDRGDAVRVAFVGQRTYHEPFTLAAPVAGSSRRSSTSATAKTAARVLADARAIDPHVVVAFRPETLPPGAIGDDPRAGARCHDRAAADQHAATSPTR